MQYPNDGLDHAWIAVDACNQVGAFVTAGQGPVAREVLQQKLIGLADIEGVMRKLPILTSAVTQPLAQGGLSSFVALVEKGLFVYDWSMDMGKNKPGNYGLVAAPGKAMSAEQLPAGLQALAGLTRFRCFFSERAQILPAHCQEIDWVFCPWA